MNPDLIPIDPRDVTTTAAASPEFGDDLALEAVMASVRPMPASSASSTAPGEGESPAQDVGSGCDSSNADPMIGRPLGAYRLIARLGEGPTGECYLADAIDGWAEQAVVTRLGGGFDGAAIVRRYCDDRHTLDALARHPNITVVSDAGIDDDGRTYLVTEHVDGRPLDQYCDALGLDIAARLRLFLRVCDAVQFAHQHAVIHRDLKPGHILVTNDGAVKVIGFGVLRWLEAGIVPGTSEAESLNRGGELVLSPGYASPEQVLGEPSTTSVDVYALGVVLYGLLTGRGPYRLRTNDPAEVFQAICEQSPERPSRAVRRRSPRKASAPKAAPDEGESDRASRAMSGAAAQSPNSRDIAEVRGTRPSRLARTLAGDLDAIVLTALRMEPERRYGSAQQLADDLQRYLDGMPVRARGGAPLYRLHRLVRRHPARAVATAAVVLAIVAGVVATVSGLLQARRDREEAIARTRRVRHSVDRLVTRIGEERLLDQPGLQPVRAALLGDARRFYEDYLAEQVGASAENRAELAATRGELGRIAAATGPPADAARVLEQSISEWEEFLRSEPNDLDGRQGLARALDDRAGVLARMKDRLDEALDSYRRAATILRSLATPDAPQAIVRELSRNLLGTARLQIRRHERSQTLGTLHEAFRIAGQLAINDPDSLEARLAVAETNRLIAQVLMEQPDEVEPALAASQQAVEAMEAVVRDQPLLARAAYDLALDLGDLSTCQQMAGKLDSAQKSGQRALELLEGLDRRHPGVLEYRGSLASTLILLADLHRRRLDPAEALARAGQARSLLEKLRAEHPEDTASQVDLARAFNVIGRVRQQSGENAEAVRAYQRAVDLLEGLPELDARTSYILACNLSLCIPSIGAKEGTQGVNDPDTLTKGEQIRRKLYGDRAMVLLRRAVGDGEVSTEMLASDPDLAAIRLRDDFPEFVKSLRR